MKLCLFKAFQGHTQVTLVPGQDIHPASVSSIDRLCSFNHIRLDINTRRARNKPERSSGLGPRGRGVIKLPKSRCSMFSLSSLRLLHCWPQMFFVLKYKGKVLNFKLRQENITWKNNGGVLFFNIVEFDLHKSQEFYGDKMWWKSSWWRVFNISSCKTSSNICTRRKRLSFCFCLLCILVSRSPICCASWAFSRAASADCTAVSCSCFWRCCNKLLQEVEEFASSAAHIAGPSIQACIIAAQECRMAEG